MAPKSHTATHGGIVSVPVLYSIISQEMHPRPSIPSMHGTTVEFALPTAHACNMPCMVVPSPRRAMAVVRLWGLADSKNLWHRLCRLGGSMPVAPPAHRRRPLQARHLGGSKAASQFHRRDSKALHCRQYRRAVVLCGSMIQLRRRRGRLRPPAPLVCVSRRKARA